MQGFKSFADPVVIELNDGITCIVGPNGSGKSNISDALRWVLGEQSPKQLRGSKMDEVIFAGTATRKAKGMAEVTLVIDNSAGLLPLEYSEVAVTRRMFRSGESEYLINGNQCRLRDIKELFMDTGIGVDGYSIIGQGKIQEIVSTKPENRREIFEEAAGVVLYKNRKAEAERKLKAATDDLERVRDIIAEIEGRIGGLKTESEKAMEFIDLRDRYRHLEVNIILHNVDGLERNLKAGEEELAELNERYDRTCDDLHQFETQAENQRLRDAELSEQLETANRDLLNKVEELHTIANRGQINSERLAQIEKDLLRLRAQLDDNAAKLESQQHNYGELEQSEKALAREREAMQQSLEDAVLQLNEHNRTARSMQSQIEQAKNSVIELNNKIVQNRAEVTTLDNYRTTLSDRRRQILEEHETQGEGTAQNRARLEDIRASFAEKDREQQEVSGKIEEVANNIISVNEEAATISAEIEQLTIRSNRATARKSTIEEMESNYEGYNNAVRQIMARGFRGIIGTVSELMKVPAGYETAIETALGGSMQHIICEDDRSAKESVEWLKRARAGRATFLPVASIHGRSLKPEGPVTEMPGYLGIASERISCDPKYREIYDQLLGRVILADDMDHAIRISKKASSAFRIVTLEGEVISGSGAITGGQYKNRSANLLERRKEIKELTKEIAGYQKRLSELSGRREECYKSVRDLKNERAELYNRLQQIEIDVQLLRNEKEHAESLAEAADTAVRRYDEEIRTIDSDIERAGSMIAEYERRIRAAEEEISALEERTTRQITESEAFSAQIESDNESIVQKRVALGELEAKTLGLNELIERVRDTMTDLEEQLAEDGAEFEELSSQRLLLTSSGQESDEKEETLRAEKTQLEETIGTVTAALDENRAAYEKTLRDQKACSGRISGLQDEKYKLEVRTARNETLLTSQKEKLWEEFEMSYAEALDLREEDFAITSGNREAKEIRVRMAELGDVNISAIEEYKSVSKRYEFMTAQEQDTSKAMEELETIIRNMDRTIRVRFKENFDKVVLNFEQTFRELFGGGHAELRLEDESDPLESGIEIIAQPPGKALKNINLMSGGEKTLTAIALMFAVLKAKPTPFCILDEVEAALDEANIERFSDYLRNFHEIQFALITHQKATMEHADVLYGVTMPEQGISRVLSLKLASEFEGMLD
ncbi:MAG: chromosome segregation protein SMC [Mogibacterium sp.]|nr:chromosome segregation protein SMC [Mogibacterium sp.]